MRNMRAVRGKRMYAADNEARLLDASKRQCTDVCCYTIVFVGRNVYEGRDESTEREPEGPWRLTVRFGNQGPRMKVTRGT